MCAIAWPHRIRAEWEVVHQDSGICTTQVYLFPDEVNPINMSSATLQNAVFLFADVNTATQSPQNNRLYWSHSTSLWSGASILSTISNGSPAQVSDEETDAQIRSKSTPSRLRGDATPYVPRRAISVGSPTIPSDDGIQGIESIVPVPSPEDVNVDRSIPNRSPTAIYPSVANNGPLRPPGLRSPRMKYVSTFPTLGENDILHLSENRRLVQSVERLLPTKKLKLPNPYIEISQAGGSTEISVKYIAMPLYWVSSEPAGSKSSSVTKSEAVGPYRTAAMWEFVGQTFARYDRGKKLKPKRKRTVREFLDRTMPPSALSTHILADEQKSSNIYDSDEVRAEWTEFVNSVDDMDSPSTGQFSSKTDIVPRPSMPVTEAIKWPVDDNRGRARSRFSRWDRLACSGQVPTSTFASLNLSDGHEDLQSSRGMDNFHFSARFE